MKTKSVLKEAQRILKDQMSNLGSSYLGINTLQTMLMQEINENANIFLQCGSHIIRKGGVLQDQRCLGDVNPRRSRRFPAAQ